MASSEALPCIHRPGKGARKASAPEYITPGQCFVLLVDSLQRARALAGIPVMQVGSLQRSEVYAYWTGHPTDNRL